MFKEDEEPVPAVPEVPAAPEVPAVPLVFPPAAEEVEPVDDEEPVPAPFVPAVPVVEPVVEPVVAAPAVEPVEPVDPVDPVEFVVPAPAAAPAIWKAMTPPNGPALLLFAIFMKHTFCCPAAVPEHVVPAGTWIAMGKSWLTFAARLTMLRAWRAQ